MQVRATGQLKPNNKPNQPRVSLRLTICSDSPRSSIGQWRRLQARGRTLSIGAQQARRARPSQQDNLKQASKTSKSANRPSQEESEAIVQMACLTYQCSTSSGMRFTALHVRNLLLRSSSGHGLERHDAGLPCINTPSRPHRACALHARESDRQNQGRASPSLRQ